ncbi:hypothetical protein, partial [Amycolatopsis sp. cmx-4-54]|uniref:hypothetical protein n=1 Tax=Amycolatopsis sp. cmx-4-54 TaxID=2790936 RepID=UPI00397DF79A
MPQNPHPLQRNNRLDTPQHNRTNQETTDSRLTTKTQGCLHGLPATLWTGQVWVIWLFGVGQRTGIVKVWTTNEEP